MRGGGLLGLPGFYFFFKFFVLFSPQYRVFFWNARVRGGGRSVSSSLIGCAPRAWLIGRSFTVPAGSYRVFFKYLKKIFFLPPFPEPKDQRNFTGFLTGFTGFLLFF